MISLSNNFRDLSEFSDDSLRDPSLGRLEVSEAVPHHRGRFHGRRNDVETQQDNRQTNQKLQHC